MVALDAGHSEIASMLYSRMNIKCSVSLSPSWEGGGGFEGGWRTETTPRAAEAAVC